MLYYKERAPYFIASHYVNLKNRPKKVENTPFLPKIWFRTPNQVQTKGLPNLKRPNLPDTRHPRYLAIGFSFGLLL